MTAWAHLPNAKHIDRVIASVAEHPREWSVAYDAVVSVARNAAMDAAYTAAYTAAMDAAYTAAYTAAYVAARDAALGAAYTAARDAAYVAAYGAARDAILALIAYDDCAKYVDMSSEKLKMWAELSEDPAAILLVPAVIAFEKIIELSLIG